METCGKPGLPQGNNSVHFHDFEWAALHLFWHLQFNSLTLLLSGWPRQWGSSSIWWWISGLLLHECLESCYPATASLQSSPATEVHTLKLTTTSLTRSFPTNPHISHHHTIYPPISHTPLTHTFPTVTSPPCSLPTITTYVHTYPLTSHHYHMIGALAELWVESQCLQTNDET